MEPILCHNRWMSKSKFKTYSTRIRKSYLGCLIYCLTISLDEFWDPIFLTANQPNIMLAVGGPYFEKYKVRECIERELERPLWELNAHILLVPPVHQLTLMIDLIRFFRLCQKNYRDEYVMNPELKDFRVYFHHRLLCCFIPSCHTILYGIFSFIYYLAYISWPTKLPYWPCVYELPITHYCHYRWKQRLRKKWK